MWLFAMFVVPALLAAAWQQTVGPAPLAPFFIVTIPAFVGLVSCAQRSEQIKAMRRILKTYTWQPGSATHKHALKIDERSVKMAIRHFRVPDPDNPEQDLGVIARRSTPGKTWRRTLATASAEGFLFAGDPRFGGVMALRERPGHLILVRPREPLQIHGGRPGSVSEAAWQRACDAGISGVLQLTEEQAKEARRLRLGR